MATKKVFSVPSVEDMEASTSSTTELDTLARFKAQRAPGRSLDQPSTSKASSSSDCVASEYGATSMATKSPPYSSESTNTNTDAVSQTSSSLSIGEVLADVGFSEENVGVPSSSEIGNAFAYLKNPKSYEEMLALPGNSSRIVPQGEASKSPSKGPTTVHGVKSGCMLVNPRQRGNPILKYIRNVPLEYSDIIPDYILGQTTCAMFLSLRYHLLNPDYIHERLKVLGQQYKLRILLVQVDVKDPHHVIKQMTKISILTNCTLILAWSPEEAGRYLEIYKVYENKPPELIMERQEGNPSSNITDALTTIRSVSKTNATTLLSTFKSLNNVIQASKEDLAFCPGIGPQKAEFIHNVLHEQFLSSEK